MIIRFDALILVFAVVFLTFLGLGGERRSLAADRPHGPLHKTRSVVMARRGMAATSQPLATVTAIRVFNTGATRSMRRSRPTRSLAWSSPCPAAWVATCSRSSGMPADRKLYGLNASGRSPAAATIGFFRERHLDHIPTHGPLSWSVPGCVDGWDQLRRGSARDRGPTCSDRPLVMPKRAFRSARSSPPIGSVPRQQPRADSHLGGLLPAGGPCARRQARSSATPASLARSGRSPEGGRDAFYRGPLADSIVAYSQSVGGLFSRCRFRRPHLQLGRSRFDQLPRVRRLGASSQRARDRCAPDAQPAGRLRPEADGLGSAEALHLMIEAKKLAYEDRAKFYADTDFAPYPSRP